MDAAYDLAAYAVNTRFEDLPPEVVEVTKRSVLDTLGVTVAASTMGQGCDEIVELLKESGASGRSTVLGYGGRLPSWMAAFANGAMVHQLDYDDSGPGAHPSGCIVPAACAMAEEVGGVTGKELIVAVAIATDIKGRMSLAGSRMPDRGRGGGFMGSPLLGYFSATAAAGRIARLGQEAMVDAFSHTLQQAASTAQMITGTGGAFRGIRDAFPNKGGVLSVLLAAKGLPGTKEPLEGKGGFYDVYYGGAPDRSCLVQGLGERFENTKVGFKPWPASAVSLGPIDAALGVLNQENIEPAEIESIVLSIAERAATGSSRNVQVENIRAQMAELGERRNPKTSIDAKFSVPFALAIACARRRVTIRDFTQDALDDTVILDMTKRVSIRETPDLNGAPSATTVEIKTRDGRVFSSSVTIVYGSPQRPIAKQDLQDKFRDCVSFSAKPVSKGGVEKAISLIDSLEDVDDVSDVMRLLG